jgi:predicted DNA-binding mobile mystery protein A
MLSTEKKRARGRLDEILASLGPTERYAVPKSGWIKTIRTALSMTGQQFAQRLGVAWQSMDDLERSEARGSITVDSLKKAAASLDCTLVYALIPNTSLEAIVEARARAIATREIARADRTMALEAQQLDNADREDRIADYILNHVRDRDLWQDR